MGSLRTQLLQDAVQVPQCDQELLVLDLHLSQFLSQPLQGLPKIRGWLLGCFHLSVLGRDLDADLAMGLRDL